MPIQVVITGGPGTGKTSVINILKKNYPVMKESARLVLARNALFKGKNAQQASGKQFQEAIWNLEIKHYAQGLLKKERLVFYDRGFFDGFAYCQLSHLHHLHERVMQGEHIHYDYVFLLDPLPEKYYATDTKRKESYKEGLAIHKLIASMYRKYGYKLIRVPFATVQQRTSFILKKLENAQHHHV